MTNPIAAVLAPLLLGTGLLAPAPLLRDPPPVPSARPSSSVLAPPAPPADGGRVPVGRGAWPLDPRPTVQRGFDPPAGPYAAGHRGVDLLGHAGQSVRSTLAGRVSFVGSLGGVGIVVVDHGFGRTTYQPVRAAVRLGDHVGRGQVIGTLSPAGSHCAPRACLHWGLRLGETYLDPLVLVGGVPVRLLPLVGPGPV